MQVVTWINGFWVLPCTCNAYAHLVHWKFQHVALAFYVLQAYTSNDGTVHRFWSVWAFIKPLKSWIKQQRRQQGHRIAPHEQPVKHLVHPRQPKPMSEFSFDRQAIMQCFVAAH